MTCKKINYKFEPIMYISLPIPDKKNITLEDCIAEFSKEE